MSVEVKRMNTPIMTLGESIGFIQESPIDSPVTGPPVLSDKAVNI